MPAQNRSCNPLPHGIDITVPGGIDALMNFHRLTFGNAQMNAEATGSGEKQGQQPAETRTFTQEELNRILAEEKRKHSEKYADYEDLKSKAAKLDEQETASQTELQKAIARAEKAERDAEDARKAREIADRQVLAATVAQEKGVPAAHIVGTTREELEASADQLLAWRGDPQPAAQQQRVGAVIPPAGTGTAGAQQRSMASGRERAEAKLAKNSN